METPKNVLVVMGSPRKGNTYRAAERIRELMEAHGPVEFKYLWLCDANLAPCRGCAACVAKGEENCPNRDDAQAIVQKMREADGVIFASPVFGWNVSGQFKIFVDRLSYNFHRPQFFDKKSLLLSTGMFSSKEVQDYLFKVAQWWGFEVAGKAGLITPPSVPARQREKNERILAKAAESFYRAIRSGRRKSPGLREVVWFHGGRALIDEQKDDAPVDYPYWKEHGWLEPGARYFVDVPVNPVYSAVGRLVEHLTRREIRKSRSL